ncbi:MAG: TldD/PmbA family protein [Myxococcales bacterium]|nr:TldD/PmbA family protein [Myxococcales bacterium]MCB9520243.1 TldD/PmbA family protein [Myxococcales bacterium]MCB9531389.1 TldD/PmbA family protein [Myxococcales bacterium]MCB9533538.1 TldD/PmbA family protein [Myxococcales bacterium]
MSQTVRELESFAASVVERATAAGATAAEVFARAGVETEVGVRDGAIETLQQGSPKSVGLRLWRGDKSASTYATDFSADAIARVIADTLALTELVDPVPEAALVDRELLATSSPELDLCDPRIAAMSPDEKLELALACEAAALAADGRVTTSGGASVSDATMARALANSHGFCFGYAESYTSIGVEVIADDADGKKRNGSWSSVARHRDRVLSPDEIGRIAAARAVRQLGAGPIATERMPVVFDPRTAASLLGMLFSVLRGNAVEGRSSYLADRLGEAIAASRVTIIDDPLMPRGLGSRPHDGEGLPSRRVTFVDAGVLQQFALNSTNARKLGRAPTGHASRPASGAPGESSSNLYLVAGALAPESIIDDVERGFYCEGLMGFGFNPATGDFSSGASGRLIEGGKLTRPVSEVTVACAFPDLFGRIDAIGSDLVHDRSTCSPTIRVSEATIAGV